MSNKTHHLQIHENYPGFSNFWKRKMRSTAQLDYGNATVARRVQGLRGKEVLRAPDSQRTDTLRNSRAYGALKTTCRYLLAYERKELGWEGNLASWWQRGGSNLIFPYTLASVILTLKNTFENPIGLMMITNELSFQTKIQNYLIVHFV